MNIGELAREFGLETHEALASLDITGTATPDDTPLPALGWTTAEAYEVLALMERQAKDLA